jgi:chondroitin AC lyase
MLNFFHLTRLTLLRLVVTEALFSPVINSVTSYSQINIITERLRKELINTPINYNAVSVYLQTSENDGSWKDIDYTNTSVTNWPALSHTSRLKEICIAYNQPSCILYRDTLVKRKITKIIDFYIASKPVSDNWWLNAIGAPVNLGSALVLMKTGDGFGFAKKELVKYSDKLLNYYTESVKKWPMYTTGANKIWLLKSSIYKACINEDESVLSLNFMSAFEDASIMTGSNDGIKSDYSYHQHRNQLYIGGYGRSFMRDILYFGTLAHETPYRMNPAQLQVLSDFVLDGFQWFCHKSVFDFGAVGREIARPGATSDSSVLTFVTKLKEMNAPRTDELARCYKFLNGEADFQSPGNRYFWKSDIMVHHGSDFYFSAKVPSVRTTGTETVNEENLKRKYLPWGATNIMTDGDEYYDIFPIWDWSRIPGVTSYLEEVTVDSDGPPRLTSTSAYAGGVTDGVFGLAAYDYSFDGIEGRKAWFFTPEAMYCFGTAINASKSTPVITSINQCFSSGRITGKNGMLKSTIDSDEKNFKKLRWVHHNNVGYFFPSGGEVTMKNITQTGSWHDINTSQSSDTSSGKVFSLWINHGVSPSDSKYEYIVIPSKNVKQFAKWVKTNPLKTILNSRDIQAVSDKSAKLYAVAFYSPGAITLEPGLGITSENACLLLLQSINNGRGYKISVSDPTATLGDVNIRISKELSGPGSILNPDKTTTLKIMLQTGDETGKTVSAEYILK